MNQSAAEVLDTVMQSQMLLKGKLEKALAAGGHRPSPEPPCAGEGPCGGPCREKSAIRLVSPCGFSWDGGCALNWRCQGQRGRGIRLSGDDPAPVELDSDRAYGLDYTINVRGPYCGDSAGAVCVRLTPCGAFGDVLPLYFSVRCLGCEPMTLHCSATLFPQACPPPRAGLSLLLDYRGGLFVEQASLSITEL